MFILGQIMKEKNFTTQMLSEVTGIPKQTLDTYRSAARPKEPSLSNGLKIADALGIDPHELFSTPYTELLAQAKKVFLKDGVFYIYNIIGEVDVMSKSTLEELKLDEADLEKWVRDGKQWIKVKKPE